MKENNEEENNIIDTSQKPDLTQNEQIYEDAENKSDDMNSREDNQSFSIRMTSFEAALITAVKREEEELRRKQDLQYLKEVKKKIKLYSTKDYLFLMVLLMSSAFNYSYLYLVNIAIATIYIFCIEKLSVTAMHIKYLCEVFSCGYSSYLLIFKLISLVLINKENEVLTKSHKGLFIDLGVCYLKDFDSFNFVMTFLPEIIVVIFSGYSILISFFCRTFEEEDRKYKEIKPLTLRKTIILAYCFVVVYSLFNISFLSLLFIILIQFALLLNSIRITEKQVKSLYYFIVSFTIFSLFIQIILTNVLNIPSLKDLILNQSTIPDPDDEKKIKKIYSIFTMVGIRYAYEDSGYKIFLNFISYLMGVFLLLTLIFIRIEIKTGFNMKTEEEMEKEKNMQEMKDISENDDKNNIEEEKKQGILKKHNPDNPDDKNKDDKDKNKKGKRKSVYIRLNIVYVVINYLIEHPNFNYEIERIISILWTYYHRNYYSLGIYLVLFCSFFFVDIMKNKYLILFILTPILLISIGSLHISNIDGILENLDSNDVVFYSKFGIKKYEYLYLEHIMGHVYYLTVVFLIYTFFTRERNKKAKDNKNLNIKNNELLENIIPKNDEQKEGLSDEDLYENKSDDDSNDSDEEIIKAEKHTHFAEPLKSIKLL